MPFIGQEPITGAYHVLDAITTSATATYNLQLNSGAFSPATANQLLVSLNGVIQKPGSSFTISGSQITFSSALTSADSIDFIIALGDVLSVGTPTDGTVTGNKLASNIGISTTGNIATTGSGTLSVAGNTTLSGTAAITGKITSTAGITFGSDTAAANVLNDYEEGTFEPTLVNDGSSTYNVRQGHYIKIGNVVTIHTKTTINTRSGGSGTTGITNLPFAMRASSPSQQTFHLVGNNNWDTNYGNSNITGYASAGSSIIYFYYNSGSNLNGISIGDIGSSGEVYVAGSYITS